MPFFSWLIVYAVLIMVAWVLVDTLAGLNELVKDFAPVLILIGVCVFLFWLFR